MSSYASGREDARAFDPALDVPGATPAPTDSAPIRLAGGLCWPPPRRFWRLAPIIILGEFVVFYGLDRLVAIHMGAA